MPYEFGYPSRLRAIHFGKGAAVEFAPEARVVSTGLQDFDKLSVVMAVRVPSAALAAGGGSVVVMEFGLPYGTRNNDPSLQPPFIFVSPSLLVVQDGFVSIQVCSGITSYEVFQCGIYLNDPGAQPPNKNIQHIPQTLTATRSNADVAPSNIVHFGSVPFWWPSWNVVGVTGPGLAPGTGLLGFATDNLSPPAVIGDAFLTQPIVASLAGFQYVFDTITPVGANTGDFNTLDGVQQHSIGYFAEGFVPDVWNLIAVSVDTSTVTHGTSLEDGSVITAGNIITINVNGVGSRNDLLGSSDLYNNPETAGITTGAIACPLSGGVSPNTLPRELAGWEMATGRGFAFPTLRDVVTPYTPQVVEMAAVQAWVGQAIDFSGGVDAFLGSSGEVIRPSTGTAADAYGPQTFVLDGDKTVFIKNKGTGGPVSPSGQISNYKPYPKKILT